MDHALSRSPADDLRPARPRLEALAARFAGAPYGVQLTCDPDLRLPAAELDAIAAIAEEAVGNALRHAFPQGRDGRIWVRLGLEGGRVRLSVRDNGVGMPDSPGSAESGGRGRMEALARRLGGFLRLGSAPFGGAEVLVSYRSNA